MQLKSQKGACDGAEAQVYKQMPDGSTDLTTVMRRQKATEAISEQTQLKNKISELAQKVAKLEAEKEERENEKGCKQAPKVEKGN